MAWESTRHANLPHPHVIELMEPRKLLAAGALDPSFSGDGKATINFGSGLTRVAANDLAVQSDGKTVVVGQALHSGTGGQFDFVVARYNGDGTPDTTFGPNHNGTVLTHVGDSHFESEGRAVAIQKDGKIVVVGEGRSSGSSRGIALARFMPDGSLDKSFSGDGKQIAANSIDTGAYAVAVQDDGKILVAGHHVNGSSDDFLVARFNASGTLDSSFGSFGTKSFGFGDDEFAQAITIDHSGTLATNKFFGGIVVVGGRVGGHGTSFDVARLSNTGALDTRFDGDGKFSMTFPGDLPFTSSFAPSRATDVLIQSDGKVVVCGTIVPVGAPTNGKFALLRIKSTGGLDAGSFGGSNGPGFVTLDIAGDDRATSLIQSSDGGILVGGISDGQFAIAKFGATGARDSTFGSNGIVRTSFGFAAGVAGLARVPLSKRFVAAGGAGFATARYLDTGAGTLVSVGALDPDASEGSGGFGNGSLIVARTERLPTATRVFINVGGTATGEGGLNTFRDRDYTLSNFTPSSPFNGGSLAFVDIPANQTFVVCTLTAIDDTRAEGPENATFSIIPNSSYEIGTPSSGRIDISDNDQATSVSLSAAADAFVRDGASAGTNFGTTANLEVKNGSSGFTRISYLKFNIGSISSVGSAKLQVMGRISDTATASIPVELFAVTDDTWTEAGVNFNNKPAPAATPLSSRTITGTGLVLYEFDATAFVSSERAAGHGVASFALKSPSSSSSFVIFNSREAASGQPRLVVQASPSVGTVKLAHRHVNAAVGKTTDIAVNWTVPAGSWRQLRDIQLRLRGKHGAEILIDWNEAANTFALFDPSTGRFGKPATLGGDGVLANKYVTVHLKTSSTKAAGPTASKVSVTFSLQFTNAAAKVHHWTIAAAASNDLGFLTRFERVGTLNVMKKCQF